MSFRESVSAFHPHLTPAHLLNPVASKVLRKGAVAGVLHQDALGADAGLAALKTPASVFAALGDETRLSVLTELCNGVPQSISPLTAGANLSRHAVTKHLRVLANAGVVRSVPIGRSLFELELQPIKEVRDYSIGYPSSGTMRWRG